MSGRLGLGERGEVFYTEQQGLVVALVYYRNESGRRRRARATATSKTAARRAVTRAVDRALLAGDGYVEPLTVAEAAEQWVAGIEAQVERGTRSPTTLDVYRSALRVHVMPAIGGWRVHELTPGRLDRFLSTVQAQRGFSSAKMCRTVLSGVCGLLVRRDVLPQNPVRDVGRLERGRVRGEKRTLTREDVAGWLAVLDASDFAVRRELPDLVRFLLGTGMRLGEALALSWADVDLDTGVVRVEWTVVRATGRGVIRKDTKAASSDRTLVLPRWCVELLAERRRTHPGDGPVFPNATGGWRDRNNVCRDLRRVRTGTAYEWFVSHTARRTVATLLDGSGLTARVIADQLGHARVSMTQDVYLGRRLPGTAAARSLDDLLSTSKTRSEA